jgi:probable rRNA maturation factor
MNRVAVNVEGVPLPEWSDSLSAYALKVIGEIGRDNWDLSILLCGDETIKALNTRYRNKPEATDVLSFELGAEEILPDGSVRCIPGDIVISLDTLRENARYFKISEDEELRRLLIHGILHLNGMDHSGGDADEPMILLQESILNAFKEEHILPGGDFMNGGHT